jgi:carotenoid cleavage dioxygenase-like enzyme
VDGWNTASYWVQCQSCKDEDLVAFSCKKRGFCPLLRCQAYGGACRVVGGRDCVQTELLQRERAAKRRLCGRYRNPYTDDPSVAGTDRDNTGNTTAFAHHGNLYALREDSHPYRLDMNTLATLPKENFGGKLRSQTVTAHPKIDPVTGEWISFGFFADKTTYKDISQQHIIDKHGKLTREEWFEMPYPGVSIFYNS